MQASTAPDPIRASSAASRSRPIQRYLNYWFSSSVDLFGGEISSNAADYFARASRAAPRSRRSTRTTSPSTYGRS
jgi:benzoyl-CoA 2,3-dioxygenase component B